MKIPHAVLLTACCLLLPLRPALSAEMVAIAGEEINMRSAPGADQPVLWQLGAGYPLEVVSTKGEWLQVKDFEGSSGWVHKKTTQKTAYVIVRANKDSAQQINVRRDPNTNAEVVAKANYGVVFKVLGVKGSWVNVEHTQGVSGWVEGSLLWGR